MNFIVDAQLPRRIAWLLREHGHDVLHTLDLPDGNRTPDRTILELAARDHRVVVTKDDDFVVSFHLRHQPEKLLLIATGNIRNADLERILLVNFPTIVAAFETADFVEVSRTEVIVRD